MRVVLAHASPETRRRFRRVLSEVGHDVIEAGGTDEALARCREDGPDVAVVDAELCGREGEQLLRSLKGDADAYKTAVVLVEPGDLDLGTAAEALRLGVQDFL